jgi:hypothetical protein
MSIVFDIIIRTDLLNNRNSLLTDVTYYKNCLEIVTEVEGRRKIKNRYPIDSDVINLSYLEVINNSKSLRLKGSINDSSVIYKLRKGKKFKNRWFFFIILLHHYTNRVKDIETSYLYGYTGTKEYTLNTRYKIKNNFEPYTYQKKYISWLLYLNNSEKYYYSTEQWALLSDKICYDLKKSLIHFLDEEEYKENLIKKTYIGEYFVLGTCLGKTTILACFAGIKSRKKDKNNRSIGEILKNDKIFSRAIFIICEYDDIKIYIDAIKCFNDKAKITIISDYDEYVHTSYLDIVDSDIVIINIEILIDTIKENYIFTREETEQKFNDLVKKDNILECKRPEFNIIKFNRVILDIDNINFLTIKRIKELSYNKITIASPYYSCLYTELLFPELTLTEIKKNVINPWFSRSVIYNELNLTNTRMIDINYCLNKKENFLMKIYNESYYVMKNYDDFLSAPEDYCKQKGINIIIKNSEEDIKDYINNESDKYKKGFTVENFCPICFSDIEENQKIVTFCGHIFCISCIKKALEINANCPSCRSSISNYSFFYILNEIDNDYSSNKIKKIYDLIMENKRLFENTKNLIYCRTRYTLEKIEKKIISTSIKYLVNNNSSNLEYFFDKDCDKNFLLITSTMNIKKPDLSMVSNIILSEEYDNTDFVCKNIIDRVGSIKNKNSPMIFNLVCDEIKIHKQ